jgi:thiamine pyrophosphate-dependent acetolactate synthase large subunit-like protein
MVSVMTKFDRRHAVAALLQDRDDLLVICGLGSPSYDVHAAGDHDGNYYLWGAMGAAALIGLGLAQAQPERKVAVITGDGEQLMGLGGLATIAVARPKNLAILVIDNGHFGETGMQMSHTGHGIEIAKIAEACGITACVIDSEAGLEEARTSLKRKSKGPVLYVVKVEAKNEPRSLPVRDAVYLKNRFRGHLGLSPT